MKEKVRDERQLRALTGLSEEKFKLLVKHFEQVYFEEQEKAYEQGVGQGTRQRRAGGGQKGKLASPAEKLLFVLYYFKNYPTFDVLATHFDMARSKACENVHKLTPILYKTLASLAVLPHREFTSVAEFKVALAGVDKLLIDVTERLHRRPGEDGQQRALYSGKKSVTR
jgi:hypothetical protein